MSGFQYKVDDRSATFDPNDVWSDDVFRNRDDASRRLYALLAGQERPLTICLNGEWGSGKTYFLTRFAQNYNERKPKGRAVYFNAWEDDFLDDPLVSIVCQLKKVAPDGVLAGLLDSVKAAAIPCLKKIGLSVAKQFVKNKLGVDADAVEVDDLKSAEKSIYDQYEDLENSRKVLRTALTRLAEEVFKTTEKPLLFIVDELDRCRPTFAIEVLERIKHLFSVPHLVFVVGVDVRQLERSIQAVYGDIDANDYLHRFFDLEVKLPQSDKIRFLYGLWQEHGLENVANARGVGVDSQRCTIDEFSRLFKFRNVTLRQIEKCVRTYAFLLMSKDNYACSWTFLAAIAVVLKIANVEAYEKFIHMRYGLGELIDMLYPDVTYQDVDDERGVFNMVQHLSRVIYYGCDKHPAHKGLLEIKKSIDNQSGIRFDATVMPKCFATSSSTELKSFYQYVFDERRVLRPFEFKEVPEALAQLDRGLQLLG